MLVYREFSRIIREGRVQPGDALVALEMIARDYDDTVMDLSISWAEVQRPFRMESYEEGHEQLTD